MIKRIILWLLIITCMWSIFFLSSQEATESDKVSEGFIVCLIKFFDFKKTLSDGEVLEIADVFNSAVRACAHFTIFAILGFLISLLLNDYGFSNIKTIVYSFVLTVFYALSDELHQSFVPGRSAQLVDLITDSCGAISGILSSVFILFIINKIRKKNHTF